MSASRSFRVLIVLAVLASLLVPLLRPAAAQDGGINEGLECPEGLVPSDEVVDLCVLPEEEADTAGDDTTGDGTTGDTADDTGDTGDTVDDVADDVADDAGDGGADDGQEPLDGAPTLDDPDGGDAEPLPVGGPQIENFTIVGYSCPVNWNPETREPEDSHDVCTLAPVPGTAYELSFNGQMVIRSGEDARVDLASVGISMPVGTWSITTFPLPGKGVPVAFCAIYDANNEIRSLFNDPVTDGYINFTLAEGEEVNCEMFTTTLAEPVDPAEAGKLPITNLRIYIWSCPVGTDAVNNPSTNTASTCVNDRAPDVPFTISRDGVEQVRAVVGGMGSIDVAVTLGERPLEGDWRIEVPVMEGYAAPVARCIIIGPAGETPETVLPVESGETHAALLTLKPDEEAVCYWFNMETVPLAAQTLGFSMTVRQCPATWNRDDQGGEDEMEAACTLPLAAPMTFSYRLGETGPVFTATTNAEGTIQFFENRGAPSAGTWFVTAALPPGTGGSVVLCKGVNSNGVSTISARDGLISNVVEIEIKAGEKMTCVWYLAPVVQQSLSIGQAWSCPEGVDPAAIPQLERVAACDPDPGVRVVIAPNFNGNLADVVASGLAMTPNPDGVATFPLVDGAVTMLTLVGDPADLQPGRVTAVSCTHTIATSGQVMTIEPAVSEGMVSIAVAEGDRLDCDLFAEAAGDPAASANASSLTIARWDCRDTVTPEDSYEDHLMNCDGSAAGDTYTFPNAGQVTAINGFAEWESIVLDGTMITNTTTQQTGEVGVVYCSASGGAGDTFPELAPTSGATITLTYPAGSSVYCDWFVHPRDDE